MIQDAGGGGMEIGGGAGVERPALVSPPSQDAPARGEGAGMEEKDQPAKLGGAGDENTQDDGTAAGAGGGGGGSGGAKTDKERLLRGEVVERPGAFSQPYRIKYLHGVYSCTCPGTALHQACPRGRASKFARSSHCCLQGEGERK